LTGALRSSYDFYSALPNLPGTDGVSLDLSGRKVLVVDDVRFTRMTLVKMLCQFGEPTVFEAADGEEGLAKLEGEAAGTACVITDLAMPKLDGLGMLKAIRSGHGAIPRDLLVIMLTGHSGFDPIGSALLLDVDAFLAKPTSKQALEACLEQVFQAREGRGTIAAAERYRAVELSSIGADAEMVPEAAAGRQEQQVPLMTLPVDSVLSRDLLFRNGRLLLRAHTRLNQRIVERLRELAPLAGLPETIYIFS
jgi:two-component system chemotaxis response regulator CheY